MKIVVTNDQGFSPEQKKRLEGFGDVKYYDELPKDAEEYLRRVKGADIICSGTAGLKDAYPKLKDVFVSIGFVSAAFLDLDVLRKNKVLLSNAPGINRHAVSEWIIGMMIYMMRRLNTSINTPHSMRKNGKLPPLTDGLAYKNVTILGRGNIAERVGKVCGALEMKVSYFNRGDDLFTAVRNADVVVNVLSSNESTYKLLDSDFFKAIKKGGYFITVTRQEIVDEDAMIEAVDIGHLMGVACDAGGILVGDTDDPYYQKLLKHPKVYVTPHISYSTPLSFKMGCDVMIDNVEAYVKGKPINLLT
jgi:phosphoglycerate dehydrogenase-like enzyme